MNLEDFGIVWNPDVYIEEEYYETIEEKQSREAKRAALKKEQLREDFREKVWKANIQPKEIDYTKLKPGMRVKIAEKNNMLSEWFVNELDQKIMNIKKVDYHKDSFQVILRNMNLNVPIKCIESIITEETYSCESCGTTVTMETMLDHADGCQGIMPMPTPGQPIASYQKPKQVKALWLGQTEGDVEVESFDLLLKKRAVGFIPNEYNERMFILMRGKDRGISIGINIHQYTSRERMETDPGIYYIFPTARDLYLWMAEGEVSE